MVTIKSYWSHIRVTYESQTVDIVDTLDSNPSYNTYHILFYCCHIWVTFESHPSHIWVTSKSQLSHILVTFASQLNHICITIKTHLNHIFVKIQSQFSHISVTFNSIWSYTLELFLSPFFTCFGCVLQELQLAFLRLHFF